MTAAGYVVGYGRISSDQERRGEGVETQHQLFDRWAAETLPGVPTLWFFDNDISGAKADRNDFEKLREVIRRGESVALWVRDQSRWARDVRLWFDLRDELLGAGLDQFFSHDRGWVKIDDTGTDIIAVVDARRRLEDRKHLMDRQRIDAEQGRPPNGRIYGYRPTTVDGVRTLEIVPEEGEVVREIARRILAGESTTAIAKDLTRRDVRTARGGTSWTSVTAESAVTSATVAG